MKQLKKLTPYKNQLLFTLLFLLIAILLMTLGFWKTLLLVLLLTIGYTIGFMQDKKRSFFSILAELQAYFER